jgi:hypothetical protein
MPRSPALAAALAVGLSVALPPAAPAASPIPACIAGDRKPDLPALVRSLAGFMKRKDLGKRDPEEIAKKVAGVGADDLSWVLDRLREVPEKERGEAAPQVERVVQDLLLSVRFTPAVLRVPDAAKRLADPSPEARCFLMADLSRLEDAEPATRLALQEVAGGADPVRLRAVDVLADLCSWGGDASRLLPALQKALADPSAAVRDVALERLANLSDPAALDWSLEHLAEPAEETTVVREMKERRCPGERAMEIATRVSKLHYGLPVESYRDLPEADRNAIREELRRWKAKAGSNPLRDGDEGHFDPLPRVTSAVVEPVKDPAATLRWWSEVDRAQFRLDLDDMEVVATSKIDWTSNFHVAVIASGARQGSWDVIARRVRCGGRHRLPRRGFGLIETSVQPLLDGHWKIWVRAYEYRGG